MRRHLCSLHKRGRSRLHCFGLPVEAVHRDSRTFFQNHAYRFGGAVQNFVLKLAAQMMAGLDGIKNKIEPMAPVDKDLYELPPEEARNIPQAPTNLSTVIDRLEQDHEDLHRGWRVHHRPDRDLDLDQARAGDRPGQPAPAPVRVRALLRRVSQLGR